ncbi:MAG: VTT domain-containing protein [Phycisphaerales bacterium]|jgi:membrane protein DedA with SNARE-associated domain|nr:VTT domain-containing protein [Phycisphaerales bacterium]
MTEFITQYAEYLPWVVLGLLLASGIGIPIGEDIIIIPAGVLIGEQMLGPTVWVPTLIAAIIGVATADMLWFMWCTAFGTRLLHRRIIRKFLHPKRLLQAKHQIDQRGIWVVVAARFIPGSRTPAITVAGLMHLRPWRFIVATWSCVVVTAPMQFFAGMLVGYGIASRNTFGALQWIIAAIVLAVVVSALAVVFARSRGRRAEPPRAHAAWLKTYRGTPGSNAG